MCLRLFPPSIVKETEFLSMIEEFHAVGEAQFVYEEVLVNQGFKAYVTWLERGRLGQLEGFSPWSAYWAFDRQKHNLVGICSVRHLLSPWMAEYGGHIGYRVRPTMRRQGFGTEILALALQEASKFGINRVLVVCEPTNFASIGVIENNGGIFERQVYVDGALRNRYWIPIANVDPDSKS